MTKQKDSGDSIKPPDDSLNNYFDDLLGGEDLLEQAFNAMDERPMPVAAGAGSARVVALPTKKNLDEKPKKPVLRAEPTSKLAPQAMATFAEPEAIQSLEQKRKLEKLLQSARTELLVDVPVATQVSTETKTQFVSDPDEIQEWDVEGLIDEVLTVGANSEVPIVAEQTQHEDIPQAGHFQIQGLEWLENGRPQWAQSRFDVLLFKVSGLTLAVPLISLGQIQPLTDELTPLFGQADWFMGFQPTAAGKIRTVNTAKFVMPERYDPHFLETAKYVMSINGVPWGLAVDSVNQPITLMPEDVKWRGDRSKRPWLAGTVKDHMCALLDIPRIGQILIEADKNFTP
ncbi:chemotaxis protein CheW [Cellvibrio sp. OA-2007]|uniref:chemotaxis protein CheW n=1 Tax=Cellvibrio sp. OA-2007 TaxID=529823 RepID=UPI000781510A|nr:chemotaxis protein CheW [Cellvibrio sp. OA-2007]